MKGLDFSFNYSVADIREPAKRNTEYSKTIKCPGTKSNDILFGQIYDVNISNPYDVNSTNVETNFNPNKKAEARVISDGIEVMAGTVQLRKIVMQGTNYVYEVVFIGKLINLFSKLGKSKLTEIDFSDLDHIYSATNIINSWNSSQNYVYPMVDYGTGIDYTTGFRIWDVMDFRPALFLKSILDRIFAFAGFSYTSTLLDSSYFASLIVPFSDEKIWADQTTTDTRKFQASQSGSDGPLLGANFTAITSEVAMRTLRLSNDSTGGNFDSGNNWNTNTWSYNVPANGIYSFSVTQNIKLERIVFNVNRIYSGNIKIQLQIRNGTDIIAETQGQYDLSTNPPSFDQTLTLATTANDVLLMDTDTVTFWFLLNNNDLQVTNLSGQLIPNSNMFTDFELTSLSATGSNEASNEIFEGDTLFFNNIIPDVEMTDLLMSVINMFNLYVTVDPLNEFNMILETRDEFYAAGSTRNWTHKLARDRAIELEPLSLLTARKYVYEYSDDGDYYNERYKLTHNENYGTRTIEVDNDFLTNTTKNTIIFSPSPLVNDNNSSRIITKIYDSEISEGAKPTESNLRVLHYDFLPCGLWGLKEVLQPIYGSHYNYPYAGHLDHPITPTKDLNFGIPFELFYQANAYTGTLQYTNANLFNLYHRQQIDEITDKDSKVMSAHFYLTALDIEKLDFRDQILIDNAYWRLNKVSDYNPFKEGLTRVELLKIKEVAKLETEAFVIGGTGTVSNENKPQRKILSLNNSKYPPFQGSVKGQNNIVQGSATEFKILGDDNFIGEGSKRITIMGSGNYVSAGLSDVSIINTDNYDVYESNTTIIDGARQWKEVAKTADYTPKDREVVLVDASGGAVVITMTMTDNFWINVKKTDSSANTVTVTAASGFIDGQASQVITTQYEAVDFYADGTNAHIR